MLVSSVWWHESAACIHVSLPSWASLRSCPLPTPLGHHRALGWAPLALQWLPAALCFTQGCTHVNAILWVRPTLPFPTPGPVHVCSLCLSLYSCPANRFIRTAVLDFFRFLIHVSGERNGNPLQYSNLENPVDRGAWWATVHGVAESRTRLKWLSSSSSSSMHVSIYDIWFFLSDLLHSE